MSDSRDQVSAGVSKSKDSGHTSDGRGTMSFNKPVIPAEHPMYIFESPVSTDTEVAIKTEIDAYLISEVDHRQCIRMGERTLDISESIDLPDAICGGFTFKQRVINCEAHCFLLARWKPDRYMRRAAAGTSQKWFLDKEFFPEDPQCFMRGLASAS